MVVDSPLGGSFPLKTLPLYKYGLQQATHALSHHISLARLGLDDVVLRFWYDSEYSASFCNNVIIIIEYHCYCLYDYKIKISFVFFLLFIFFCRSHAYFPIYTLDHDMCCSRFSCIFSHLYT